MYRIVRCDLNGKHYLLDSNNRPVEFLTYNDALDYCCKVDDIFIDYITCDDTDFSHEEFIKGNPL